MATPPVNLGGPLTAQTEMRDGVTRIALKGAITEAADFNKLGPLRSPMVIDLGGVERINSIGVRNWIHFVKKCETGGIDLLVERASPMIVQQISMISNFMGQRAKVTSLYVPYFCETCNDERMQLVQVNPGETLGVAPTIPCPKCHHTMQLDEPEAMYASLFKR